MSIDRFRGGRPRLEFHSPDYGYVTGGNIISTNGSNKKDTTGYHLADRPASPTLLTALQLVAAGSPRTIGDLGSGDGHVIDHLGRNHGMHHRVYAADQDAAAIARVQLLFAQQGRTDSLAVAGDITKSETLAFIPNDSLDACFSWRVIHGMEPSLQAAHLAIVRTKLADHGQLHLAVLSDQDHKREKLEAAGMYLPNQMNECVDVMGFNQKETPKKDSWQLFFFSEENLHQLAQATGFVVASPPVTFQEETGFDHLKKTGDPHDGFITYHYVVLEKDPQYETADVLSTPYPPSRRRGQAVTL